MPVLCESSVYPSGLALAATCAPTWPAAPALVSTTTGCLSSGSIMLASGRVTMSLMPPGGNALMIVIACEGKASCAWVGPATTSAVVPTTKLRRSIIFLRTTNIGPYSLETANCIYGLSASLGVFVPEFCEGSLVEVSDLIANVVNGGFELIAGRRFFDGIAQHLDDRRRCVFRREHADPQRELDVVSLFLQRR